MRRAVITGLGIVSCIGHDQETVANALRNSVSGIKFKEEYKTMGMRSQVAGQVDIDVEEHIERKARRFMGDAAAYAHIALGKAITDAQLPDELVSNVRTGLVAGSGGASAHYQLLAADLMREKGIRKVGPYMVPRTMASTVAACVATAYKIKGINYGLTSACATSAHCIGHALEQIQLGKQDIVFAGGGEEESWEQSILFDAMGAMSSKYNDTPDKASRAFDTDRDGFVIAGGGGFVVVEEREHAINRGAPIYAEIVGYGATSDGHDMVAPSGEGAVRCMQQALATVNGPIDYINTHGTSTPVGDSKELGAVQTVFEDKIPAITSTKSLTGHSLGAAGVQEAIYSLIMQNENFIAASANIENMTPEAEGLPVITETKNDVTLTRVMSNSFGFGGTNASLVFEKHTS